MDGAIFLPFIALEQRLASASKLSAFFIVIPFTFVPAAYAVLFNARFGCTVGKWLSGVRITRLDLARIGWKEAFLRSSVDVALAVVSAGVQAQILWSIPEAEFVRAGYVGTLLRFRDAFTALSVTVSLWTWSELAVLLFNERKRGPQDFIAGTVAVNAPPVPGTIVGLRWLLAAGILVMAFRPGVFLSGFLALATPGYNAPWKAHSRAGHKALGEERFPEAEKEFAAALAEAEKLPKGKEEAVYSVRQLQWLEHSAAGRKAMDVRNWDDAAREYDAARVAAEGLGPENEKVALSLEQSAVVSRSRGRAAEAEGFLKRAIPIMQKSMAPTDSRLIAALCMLGAVYHQDLRDYPRAEALFREALELQTRLNPKNTDWITRQLTRLKQDEAQRSR